MEPDEHHVVMLATENGALRGGKVGGVADVIRHLPEALTLLNYRVTVIIPSYGFLHRENPSHLHSTIEFPFAGESMKGEFWEVEASPENPRLVHLLFEHPGIRGNPIYINDPPQMPFMQDATKYALFCSAVGQFIKQLPGTFVLHLHDWHTGMLFVLREMHPEFAELKRIRTVFTIHNLAIQGTRPMRSHGSSVEGWFPELFQDPGWLSAWVDRRYPDPCFTPMAAGIRYADKVNTVSPTYADEILRHDDPANDDHGGEGLEDILQKAWRDGRLYGILNGCDYPEDLGIPKLNFPELVEAVNKIVCNSNRPGVQDACGRLERLKANPPSIILTSVTRVVHQKVRLFLEYGSSGETAIDQILKELTARNGIYIFLGTGVPDCEARLWALSKKYERFLFINDHSEKIAQALYGNASMFLMPSSYEPCGISQMIAMRDGLPCIVHLVGGLKDTVIPGVNGFGFSGNTLEERVDNFALVTKQAIKMFFENKRSWTRIKKGALNARCTWATSAQHYIDLLYS